MTEATARKAVVTTEQVRAAFASYVLANVRNGDNTIQDNEFDKGARGRGFAEYTGKGIVVRNFDTKDEALTYYGLLAEGMWRVLDKLPQAETEAVSEAPEEAAKPVTRKAAPKAA